MVRGAMKHLFLLATFALPAFAAAPPTADREAILAMAGTHAVHFKFRETAVIPAGYEVNSQPYDENAIEIVKVVEDRPDRIALQHLLVVQPEGKEAQVIKHWAQIWTWQDTEILDYCGEDGIHEWRRHEITPEQAAGTWSQLVTQVDDTPRYEGYGKWVHQHGESYWQSSPTRRPLPRREYTKREDYDYLLVTNRHSLIADGWLHFQDNRKIIDREDQPARVIAHEIGLNTYTRTESELAPLALGWWEANGSFWDGVRNFWHEAGESAPSRFSYSTHKNGQALSKLLGSLEEEGAARSVVDEALQPYVISK